MTKKELIKKLRGAHDDAEIIVNIKAERVAHEGNHVSDVKTGIWFPNAKIPEKVVLVI